MTSKALRVICVLLDAANEDVAFSPKVRMPALKSIRNEGLFVHSKTVLPSSSLYARHAAFSGSYPGVSGIRFEGSTLPAETLFDVAFEYGYITIVSGGWEGDARSLNSRGPVTVFSAPEPETLSDMYLVKRKRGFYTSSYVIDLAYRFIKENPKFKILYADFLDSDCVGHRFKETSLEYRRVLEYEDQQLKRLLDEVTNLGLRKGALWIIFTDHGMINGSHGGADALDTWIIVHGDSVPSGQETVGTILDICPTICDALNMRLPQGCRAVSLLRRIAAEPGQA